MDGENEQLELDRMARLATSRQAFHVSRKKTLLAAELIAEKLNKQVAEGHDTFAFLIAFTFAFVKDGLDIALDFLFGIGEIPFLGQIPGWVLSAILAYFLWGKGWFAGKYKVRFLYFGLGFFVDNLPLFNDLPLNIISILYAWHHIRERARQSQEWLQELGHASEKRIKEIEQELFEEEGETAYA